MIKNTVEHVLPHQRRVLNDQEPGAAPSHAIRNLRIAAGLEEGEFYGYQFQDSDLAKWMEAASFSLIYHDSEDVRRELKEAIELIAKARQPDGYMDTHYIVKQPDKKWKDGDKVEVSFGMEPVTYCAEEIDNGALLQDFRMDPATSDEVENRDLFGGMCTLKVSGIRTANAMTADKLYIPFKQVRRKAASMTLIPYYLWNNRGEGEMTVWMNSMGG